MGYLTLAQEAPPYLRLVSGVYGGNLPAGTMFATLRLREDSV
jgi:hypothetical protein